MIGGQLLYYGPIKEATNFWLDAGADIVMLKPHKYRDFFDGSNINKKYIEKIKYIKDKGLQILLHIDHLVLNGQLIEASNIKSHKKLTKVLKSLIRTIRTYELYPELCLGMPSFDYSAPKKLIKIKKETAIKSSRRFFSTFAKELEKTGVKISFENMGFRGLRNKFLGYNPSHFKKIMDNKDVYNICIDVGHIKLTNFKLKDFLNLPFKVTTLHLHSNNGKKDTHDLLTKSNAPRGTLNLLKRATGPQILELKNKEPYNRLISAIQTLRKNKLID